MTEQTKSFFKPLTKTIESLSTGQITEERKVQLQVLINYISEKYANGQEIKLNFICTHNSRRSQFGQIWAQVAAYYNGIEAKCYSGGTEITAFNEKAVSTLKNAGFKIAMKGDENPLYDVFYSEDVAPVGMFSKVYDDATNPTSGFAAVMTCSHAEENCPFVAGTEKRISLNYDDPKEFDGTAQEVAKYHERSMQIASEMFYVFSQISNKLKSF
ncbi:MAG: protein-tyrosine-phosphatase [Cyclobacteriaceae bacterium]